jgi:predicted TIM-barrel fold metal-dependent hydrolase
MFPIYAFCEKKEIPILFHVNAGRYQAELENVLKRFPKLKVICPHFCLSSARLERLEYLLDQYPNLYTDISFGYLSHLTAGLKRFSANPRKYRNFMNQYQDRIFFGTDMVVSKTPYKTESWLAQVSRVYRDFLEKKTYDFFALSGERLRGLHLNQQVLEKIYRLNFERFMGGHDEE